eukprot:gene10949-22866_t
MNSKRLLKSQSFSYSPTPISSLQYPVVELFIYLFFNLLLIFHSLIMWLTLPGTGCVIFNPHAISKLEYPICYLI